LAILQSDAAGNGYEAWDVQIDGRAGQDQFAYDSTRHRVVSGADGIPEIMLRSTDRHGNSDGANVVLVDLNTRLQPGGLVSQIEDGWKSHDLRLYDGRLLFDGGPVDMRATTVFPAMVQSALRRSVGQCRICLLYNTHVPDERAGFGRVRCVGLVAGRIMSVRAIDGVACEIVFQPGVMTTRTAVLADARPRGSNTDAEKNPYIYKLHLTQ
jgi:hypothetical protein